VLRPPGSAPLPRPALAEIDFVVVDVETTGWEPERAAITEIAAVRLRGGLLTGEFSSLVNPGGPVPADIAALTGIDDGMVGQAPPITRVLPGFLAFASGCVLAAHNAPFDVSFLATACRVCGIGWPACAVLDTAVLARLVLDPADVPDRKLLTLAEYFGARTTPCHRALADAKATADVLLGLLGLRTAPRRPVLARIGA
jgi:DNA polymerase III subunit epsilon